MAQNFLARRQCMCGLCVFVCHDDYVLLVSFSMGQWPADSDGDETVRKLHAKYNWVLSELYFNNILSARNAGNRCLVGIASLAGPVEFSFEKAVRSLSLVQSRTPLLGDAIDTKGGFKMLVVLRHGQVYQCVRPQRLFSSLRKCPTRLPGLLSGWHVYKIHWDADVAENDVSVKLLIPSQEIFCIYLSYILLVVDDSSFW